MAIVRDKTRGINVCDNVIQAAVENVKGDASKGFHYVAAKCNQPATLSVSENAFICPKCDGSKITPVGWIRPRTINAKDIRLTSGELKQCGLTEDPTLKDPVPIKKERKPKEAKKAVEAKVSKTKKDELSFVVQLSELESGEDVAALLIKKAITALDGLPTPTLAESKRLIRVQEKLEAMVRV